MQLVILGKPMGKQRPKVALRGRFAQAYTPQKTVNYETLVKCCYMEQCPNATLFENKPLKMSIEAYYQIPSTFSKVKKEKALRGEIRPLVKPDLDNVVKIICDALNGYAYQDDNLIVEIVSTKKYAEQPFVKIKIEEVELCNT